MTDSASGTPVVGTDDTGDPSVTISWALPGPTPLRPTVTGVSPSTGTTAGGTTVTITGTDFTGASEVQFGATDAATFSVTDATHISATSPAESVGTVDVTVTTLGGLSPSSAADQFIYSDNDTDLGIAAGVDPAPVAATSAAGAPVNFTVPTASDEGGETPSVSCTDPSNALKVPGDTFPVGQTQLTCTASDNDDNPSTASTTLTVTVNTVLDHLVITPGSTSITAGAPATIYTAEGFDAQGNDLGDVTLTTTFSVDGGGFCISNACNATAAGTHAVTGTNGTATGTASLIVNAGPVSASVSSLAANPSSVIANATATITVTLTDAFGNPIAGKSVKVSQTAGSAAAKIAPPSGTTTAAGTTRFSVSATTLGTDTFSARDTTDSVTLTHTTQVTFVAGPVSASKSTVAAKPTSVTVSTGATTSALTVTLRDANGNPVAGKDVTVVRSSGPSGTGYPVISPADAITGSNGVAVFSVSSTVIGTDTFRATDSTDSIVVSQTASVTFTPGPVSVAKSSVTANPTSVPATGKTASIVTVTLRDQYGNPVAGKKVSLTKTSGGGTPKISPASTTGTTGSASFSVTSTTKATDTFTAVDTTDSLVIGTVAITFT
ncbi:MAG TPA: Ig-like domain-containing protein [Acidimicrobiales bacterium]|nr:Ig-like domain-containing protein [Acidimicrobiales bacterium]